MARRKDHDPKELKRLILTAATNIIYNKGLFGLSARSLATEIGYAPGTIYNFYRDMDALITEVNFSTLQQLYSFCRERVESDRTGFEAVRRLAFAYMDFARTHERAWRTLFIETSRKGQKAKLPLAYRKCLADLFELIENTLEKNLHMPIAEATKAARILWASMHGITALALDGRLQLIGIGNTHAIIDDLLTKYLNTNKTEHVQK